MVRTIYHGDNYNTRELDAALMNSGNNQEGIGIYFSDDKSIAKSYGKNIVSLEINTKNFLPSRESIGDFVSKRNLSLFLREIFKLNNEFWYVLANYGVEVNDSSEVKSYHFEEVADLMFDEEVRNFQITIVESVGVETFLYVWKKIIKKQGTMNKNSEHENWYAVLYTDTNLVQEKFNEEDVTINDDYMLEKGDKFRVL